MTGSLRVAVATFGRSDFSILRPLCEMLVGDPDFEAGLLVGGAHFEATSGRTVTDVEASGLPIVGRIDKGEADRSPRGTVEMMAAQMTGFADAVCDSSVPRPDLVLILGDRFEAVSAGLAMVPLGIPVGHISGGSITKGALDDVFRHCLTKIAAVHFCDLPRFARRIHHMGEATDRIFTTGALGLDAFARSTPRSFDDFVDAFDLGGLKPGFVLATLHPETARPELTRPMADAMVTAITRSGRQAVYTYPNADTGADDIVAVIERHAGDDGAFVVRSFGADWFPTAMANAGLMVGNSSSAIIEAATFGLPVVDIGGRQEGREHGTNVVHSARDAPSIAEAMQIALSPGFSDNLRDGNIYGDGRGAERVIAALRSLDREALASPKEFVDPDPTFTGEMLDIR